MPLGLASNEGLGLTCVVVCIAKRNEPFGKPVGTVTTILQQSEKQLCERQGYDGRASGYAMDFMKRVVARSKASRAEINGEVVAVSVVRDGEP